MGIMRVTCLVGPEDALQSKAMASIDQISAANSEHHQQAFVSPG